jgi:predicted O-methyltransferase YrrM
MLFSLSIYGDGVEGLKDRVCTILPSIDGWCSAEKAMDFIDLVMEVKPKVYVEIGVFAGKSVFPVASALKYLGEGVIFCIDPWDKMECMKYLTLKMDQPHLIWWGKVPFDKLHSAFLNNVKRYGLGEQCITIKSSAQNAVSQIDGSIDILYIDANYSEQLGLEIAQLYLPKVRSGGYIWLNDALSEKVQAATEFLLESCDHVKFIDYSNDSPCKLFKKK